jgi:hypothetical protein
MKSREEQLTWAKQRALICVDIGGLSDAVTGLRADLDEIPLTKGVVSSDQTRRAAASRSGPSRVVLKVRDAARLEPLVGLHVAKRTTSARA